MIFKRYGGGAKDVFSMPFLDGCELVKCALDAENEEKFYARWVAGYQKEMSFLEFKQKLEYRSPNQAEKDTKTEDILRMVKDIIG